MGGSNGNKANLSPAGAGAGLSLAISELEKDLKDCKKFGDTNELKPFQDFNDFFHNLITFENYKFIRFKKGQYDFKGLKDFQ